jgi:hypothetical protein
MKLKRRLDPRIKGWFQKETAHLTEKKMTDKNVISSHRWSVAGIVFATVEGALLGFVGDATGLTRLFSFFGWLVITLLSMVITAAAWNAAWLKKQAHKEDLGNGCS